MAAACSTSRSAELPADERIVALESTEAVDIERLEDARLLGQGKIEALTRVPSPALRARALLALARLQAPETAGVMAAALDDPEPDVRATAAFALGALGVAWAPILEPSRALAERRLIERLATEADGDVRDALIEALGKVGGRACLPVLARWIRGPHGARAAIALGLLAKASNGAFEDPSALPGFQGLLASRSEAERFAGAYALMRYGNVAGRSALWRCLKDPSAEVRALCARGVAALGSPEDTVQVAPLASDADERVAVEAGRGLARLAAACDAPDGCPALRALESVPRSSWSAALVSAVTAEPITVRRAAELFDDLDAALAEAIAKTNDGLERSTLARMQCQVAVGHDRALGWLDRVPACGAGLVSERERGVKAAQALAQAKSPDEPRVAALARLAKSPEAATRAAAAAGLVHFADPDANALLVELLYDADWTVVAEAAHGVEVLMLPGAALALVALLERAQCEAASDAAQAALAAAAALKVEAALPAARRLLAEGGPHVRQAAARTIGALTGQMPATTPPPWKPGPYAHERLADRVFVRLSTDRGSIRLQLFPHDAPRTVQNFVYLIRKGFYNGLTFHRVVPGFLVQGGDPRGDGRGGVGYTIRCEMNRHLFQEGSVGMAVSAKDTGGSRFFITLSRQPDLDGRFTQFAQVVEGMDAVRTLVEGDRILRATVEATAAPGPGIGQTRQP